MKDPLGKIMFRSMVLAAICGITSAIASASKELVLLQVVAFILLVFFMMVVPGVVVIWMRIQEARRKRWFKRAFS